MPLRFDPTTGQMIGDSEVVYLDAGGSAVPVDPTHGLPTTLATLIAGEDATNNRLRNEVQPADSDSILETLQAAAGAVAVGAAANVKGYNNFLLDISGTFVGTVTFQGTIDDTIWFTVGLLNVQTGAVATTATAVGQFTNPTYLLPLSQMRANVTAWTSGAITVKSRKHPR